MSYRCISAFEFNNTIYSGGASVSDDDPILATHGAYFVKVAEVTAAPTETASAAPGEKRAPVKKAAPAPKPVESKSDKEGDNNDA
ncbi:MAG: hypothetical protein VYA67_21980 [Actinomycetota bacterium]|nr:hypothetical protein [Actinomycetota bacterium]